MVKFDNADCTGVLVGPRVLLTGTLCVPTDNVLSFTYDGQKHKAVFTTSTELPAHTHDLSAGLLQEPLTGVAPVTIGGNVYVNLGITIAQYGASTATGLGEKRLRAGDTLLVETQESVFVTKGKNEAHGAFGDQGGPAYIIIDGEKNLLGHISTGNMQDTTYFVRLDSKKSKKFLSKFAADNQVEICGINKVDCL